jgi:predicted ATPase/class 3 adenylate cyclase/Tfp pilus assembly protein PilF
VSEICAVVQTDIVDSTKIAAALGDDAMRGVWEEHDRGARDLLRTWRGREVDKTDGFLLLFIEVADAAGYALAYHRFLDSMSHPLRARIGIHRGTVTRHHNRADDVELGANTLDVTGLAIPIATRVMSVARGGQTLLSAAAGDGLRDPSFHVQSHGHWRMKGFEEPFELLELGDPDSVFMPPPDGDKVYRVVAANDLWIPLATLKHTLPAERDAFIGRSAELNNLAQRFRAGTRLVTLVGIGGVGKTRLAQRFGWTWLGDFPGGIWFCDLSQARDFDGVVRAVARGLELSLGRGEPVEQIGRALAGRERCLVIVDNYEQVTALAEATLGVWLDMAPHARFLVTTRETLGVAGEQTLALEPLDQRASQDLFRRRAVAASHTFRLRAEDNDAIAALTAMLDGLPLAIELAAARIRIMPPHMLLERMGERFKVLSTRGGRPARQATLLATFDWSWQLLSPTERRALAQLSVFEGGFTLGAAEAVIDIPDNAYSSLDLVQSLVEKSLLRQASARRFGMLRSLHEYVALQLRDEGAFPGSGFAAEAEAHARHWHYFAALDEGAAVDDGCADIDNLIVACRRASAAHDSTASVRNLAVAWAGMKLRGPYGEAVELAAEVRRLVTHDTGAIALVDWVAGAAEQQLGKVKDARQRFQEALPLARGAGATATEARLLCSLSELLRISGDITQAREHLNSSLDIARSLGERRLELNALNGLGAFYEHQGQLDESQRYYERALELARAVGDRRAEGGLLGNLGSLEHNRGHLDGAANLYEQAIAHAQASGDRKWESNMRCNLGLLHHDRGSLVPAREQLEVALTMSRTMGNARLECAVLCNIGIVLEAADELESALANYSQAVALANALGDRRSEGQFRSYLGLLLARCGRHDEAEACLAVGDALLTEVADTLSLALLLCNTAEAQLMAGRKDQARRALDRALPLARAIGVEPSSDLGKRLERVQNRLRGDVPAQLV